MARTDLSLGKEVRRGAPYRSLCVEVLMVALRDRRKGRELSEGEWERLDWWAGHVGLSAWILDPGRRAETPECGGAEAG